MVDAKKRRRRRERLVRDFMRASNEAIQDVALRFPSSRRDRGIGRRFASASPFATPDAQTSFGANPTTLARIALLDRANAAGRQDLILKASAITGRLAPRNRELGDRDAERSWENLERLLDAAGVP